MRKTVPRFDTTHENVSGIISDPHSHALPTCIYRAEQQQISNRPSISETMGKKRKSTIIIMDYIHAILYFTDLYTL